jgi:hypothetical protein
MTLRGFFHPTDILGRGAFRCDLGCGRFDDPARLDQTPVELSIRSIFVGPALDI